MARFLFWNIGRKPVQRLIADICEAEQVDVLILAESRIDDAALLRALNVGKKFKFILPLNPSDRLSFFVRLPSDALQILYDDPHLAIRALDLPIGPEILVAAVHLPSKMWKSEAENEQAMFATRVVQQIENVETERGHSRTIVVGDFNMNPFETGLVNSEAFHAVMDRRIAAAKGRTVQGRFRPYFYNPMWSRMGDESAGPPGTYFRDSGFTTNIFWHSFDQVLVRPELLDALPLDGVKVLTSAENISLTNANTGRPNSGTGSDHLPLVFDLLIEELAPYGNV